jgi:hypothetical protein
MHPREKHAIKQDTWICPSHFLSFSLSLMQVRIIYLLIYLPWCRAGANLRRARRK